MKKTLTEYLTSSSGKRKLYFLLVLFLATLLLFTACGKKEGDADVDKPKSNQQSEKQQEEEKAVSLAELKKAGEEVYEYFYDYYLYVNGEEATYQKIWVKPGKFRSEMDLPQGMGRQISIFKNNEIYLYQPDLKQATKMSTEMAGVDQDFESPVTYFDQTDEATMKFLSREVFDGKDCLLYEFKSPAGVGRLWIWEEKKMVLRSEIQAVGGENIVSEFLNFVVGPVDDAIFDLPQDTQIIDLANLTPKN